MNDCTPTSPLLADSSVFRRYHPLQAVLSAAGLLLAVTVGASAAEFPQGLVLHFGFDDGASMSSIVDKSGRGNGGRGTDVKWNAAGKQAGAAEFGWNGSVVAVPSSASLNATQQSIAVWFKTSRTDAVERCLFDRHASTGYALKLAGADGGNKGRLKCVVAGQSCFSDDAVTDGIWHHAAATFNGEQAKLYVDGQLQKQTVAMKGSLAASTNELTIGMNRSNPSPQEKGQSFSGLLDEVMIFDRAISAEQVQAVMAAAKPKFSQAEVTRRLAELKELLDRGLILPEFYERKVRECEPSK